MQNKSSQNTTKRTAHISATCFDQDSSSSGWPRQMYTHNSSAATCFDQDSSSSGWPRQMYTHNSGANIQTSVRMQLYMHFSFISGGQTDDGLACLKHVADVS